MSGDVAAIVDLFRVSPDDDGEHLAGKAEFHADGRLVLLDADPEFASALAAAITAVNGKPNLVELVPPAEDAPRFATASRVTERNSPNFLTALDRYMRRYYGFALG